MTVADSTHVSRRRFLAGLGAGSLVLAVPTTDAHGLVALLTGDALDDLPFEPDLFVTVASDGAVTIVAHRSEMGTGIRTALPMVVADELGADWDRVTIEQASGDQRYGSQNTDGSRSVRRFYQRMRVAGATARTMLEQAAAAQWGVKPAECTARDHEIVHVPTDRTMAFGDLVSTARTLEVPEADTLRFKPKSERRYIGHGVPITDLDGIVTGKAVFGSDARRPNQVFAVVARSPVLGGKVDTLDDTAARAVPGVVDVVQIPAYSGAPAFQALGGVAVLANSTWAAIQGRDELAITWTASPHESFDSATQEAEMVATAREPGRAAREVGDTNAALDDAPAASLFEADYYVPMLAHASMEPPCALAEVELDASGAATKCTIWAPTQNPQAAQGVVAQMLSLRPPAVDVRVTLLGGGFGRKSKPDFIAEAAYLAKATGRPVHVTWTREDDIQHDYYHTPGAMHMKAALGDDGLPTAWLQRSVFPSISSTFNPAARYGSSGEMGMGFTDVPYDVPNLLVENGPAEGHVRIGWLRSVAHVYHGFAVCSFPDELAHRAGQDPYAYLMKLLGPARHLDLEGVEYANHGEPFDRYPFDVGRLRNVTERVARNAGWGKRLPKGRGYGIACHRSFLSYCANVVEVDVSADGTLRIPNVWIVIDAGTVIHPDRVRAQLEGAAVFSTSLALGGEITGTEGAIDQSNFDTYPIARIDESPRKIHVEIVESDALPSGVGEVGVPQFAPALTNAIFAATGKRIRRLPLFEHDLSWS